MVILLLVKNKASVGGEIECPYPYIDVSKAVQVHYTFRFNSFEYIKDVEGILGCSAYLISKWYDPCGWKLAQKLYPNRTKIRETGYLLDAKYFWIPLIMEEGDSNPRAYGPTDLPLAVNSDGFIEYWGRKKWKFTCQGRIAKFPFDQHRCTFSVNVWETTDFVTLGNASIELLHGSFEHGGLSLFNIEFQAVEKYQVSFSCKDTLCYSEWAVFPVILRRKWFPYYFHGVIVPFQLLIILQLSTFLLPYDQAERIALSATVFLSSAVFSSQIMIYFPETSEHIYIVTSGTLVMTLNAFATVYFVTIYSYKDKLTNKTISIVHRIFSISFIFLYAAIVGVTFYVIFD